MRRFIVGAAAVAVLAAGCSAGSGDATEVAQSESGEVSTTEEPTEIASVSPSETPSETPSVEAVAVETPEGPFYGTVGLACDESSGPSVKVVIERRDDVDFSAAWAHEFEYCDATTEDDVVPTSDVELAAYALSGYDDNDIDVLYQICATVDASDYYLSGAELSAGQTAEVNGMLALCPDHPFAEGYREAVEGASGADAPQEEDQFDAEVSYANCTAVREAGAAPIHRGDPGYSSKLDRDGDGIACE
ncbi:excalibur calcium-binding domain-containing protein [Demequina sp. NBRC 110054]|uniref:excalibur calcium-binding domain-containing protein n=1 Tax=Demequina sp. NBRC 110054 TaxID=1570343 RepID=UPI001F2AA341|nr:excalibur calcium-binding domain-containing protein [Demequina sp. NBRC 110054]